MQYILDFKKTLSNKKNKGLIDFVLIEGTIPPHNLTKNLIYETLPTDIRNFFASIHYLKITNPRCFEILAQEDMKIIDNHYLHFSTINDKTLICMDLEHINEAGQLDIISIDTGYIITKTIQSYITNKTWAWIDRGRCIWKAESHFD